MRPTAHARRLSSRAASSRHAVDAVVVGNPVPLSRRKQRREQRPEPYGLIKRRSVSTVLGLPMFIRLNAGCSGLSR